MPDKAPDGWRNVTARELDAKRDLAEMMAENMRVNLAKIIIEPLPEKITALLTKLLKTR